MEVKFCEKTYNRVRADGTVYRYTCKQKYYTKGIKQPISDKIRQKIIELYDLGVPVTKISNQTNVSPFRIKKILKNKDY